MKIVEGERMVIQPNTRRNDADNVYGAGWRASRGAAGITLRYMTGALNGSSNEFALSEEEFERLRADPAELDPIIHAHGF